MTGVIGSSRDYGGAQKKTGGRDGRTSLVYRVLGTTRTDKGMGISGGSRKCDSRKGRQAEKKNE